MNILRHIWCHPSIISLVNASFCRWEANLVFSLLFLRQNKFQSKLELIFESSSPYSQKSVTNLMISLQGLGPSLTPYNTACSASKAKDTQNKNKKHFLLQYGCCDHFTLKELSDLRNFSFDLPFRGGGDWQENRS